VATISSPANWSPFDRSHSHVICAVSPVAHDLQILVGSTLGAPTYLSVFTTPNLLCNPHLLWPTNGSTLFVKFGPSAGGVWNPLEHAARLPIFGCGNPDFQSSNGQLERSTVTFSCGSTPVSTASVGSAVRWSRTTFRFPFFTTPESARQPLARLWPRQWSDLFVKLWTLRRWRLNSTSSTYTAANFRWRRFPVRPCVTFERVSSQLTLRWAGLEARGPRRYQYVVRQYSRARTNLSVFHKRRIARQPSPLWPPHGSTLFGKLWTSHVLWNSHLDSTYTDLQLFRLATIPVSAIWVVTHERGTHSHVYWAAPGARAINLGRRYSGRARPGRFHNARISLQPTPLAHQWFYLFCQTLDLRRFASWTSTSSI